MTHSGRWADGQAGKQARPGGKLMYKEFLEWADEDTLAEWVDGEVEMRSPASRRHQALVGFLSGVMGILGPGAMVGSPEHTGIDRSLSMIGAVWRRFPRTRGDRPGRNWHIYPIWVVPPHTRG